GPGGDQNYTSTFSGTSAAAPQVSGVAALLLSIKPYYTAAQVKHQIRAGADWWGYEIFGASDVFAGAVNTTTFGVGKLNAYRTLVAPDAPPPVASIGGPGRVRPNASCNWWANTSGGVPPLEYYWYKNSVPIAQGTTSVTTFF